MTAVTRRAEARLSASSMIPSSKKLSLTGEQSGWTMKTSCSRTFWLILTKMLSLENLKTSARPSPTLRYSQMSRARRGCALPAKIDRAPYGGTWANTARGGRAARSGAGGRAWHEPRARQGRRSLGRLVGLRLQGGRQVRSRDAAFGLVVVAEDAHQALAIQR